MMHIQEFIQTLGEPIVRKLCVRSLLRGKGSMNYIHSLLIMEDDLLDDDSDTTLCIAPVVPTAEQPSLGGSDPEPGPSPDTNLPWCKCGICQVMPQEIENKCCGKRGCVTNRTRFQKLCLDPDALQLAIRNRGDIQNDRDDNSTRSFRKASYRQYVLDRYGYLGKGNSKVCPSCVVKVIRNIIHLKRECIWDSVRTEEQFSCL